MQQVVVMGYGGDAGYRDEAVPGSDGVALCEEDVVSMNWVELKRLGWGAVQSSLVAQTDPRLDLLQHLHDGDHQGSHWEGPPMGRMTVSLSVRC